MKTNHRRLRRLRVKRGIRKKISGTRERPRFSVFRSNRHIYAQLIDDTAGVTLASASTKDADLKGGTPVEVAKEVGGKLAERAKAAGIDRVVFDRNGYKYHGRVQALGDGAREAGLEF